MASRFGRAGLNQFRDRFGKYAPWRRTEIPVIVGFRSRPYNSKNSRSKDPKFWGETSPVARSVRCRCCRNDTTMSWSMYDPTPPVNVSFKPRWERKNLSTKTNGRNGGIASI